jgi:hypothetical protein
VATKTKVAYGEAILKDLSKVIDRLGEANGLLERCMKAMDVASLGRFFGRVSVN